jgi:hypothetical protein
MVEEHARYCCDTQVHTSAEETFSNKRVYDINVLSAHTLIRTNSRKRAAERCVYLNLEDTNGSC